jgi:hypothetical protein
MFQRTNIILAVVSSLVLLSQFGCNNANNPLGLSDTEIEEGMKIFRDQVRVDIKDNPVIVDKIGAITSFELDMDASELLEGENDFVFDVAGTKGQGVLTATCITIDADTEDVTAGSLKMSTGETVNLFP